MAINTAQYREGFDSGRHAGLLQTCPYLASSAVALEWWTAESMSATRLLFEEIKQKLQRGEQLPPLSISRSLDHWGVVGGDILDMAARISNQLRSRHVR